MQMYSSKVLISRRRTAQFIARKFGEIMDAIASDDDVEFEVNYHCKQMVAADLDQFLRHASGTDGTILRSKVPLVVRRMLIASCEQEALSCVHFLNQIW